MNILAVVAARNEISHIRRCIECLVANGLEVAIIDHASTDGTREVAESYLGNGVLQIKDLAWEGHFSLEKQLMTKAEIYDNSSHPWLAHFDADEWPLPGGSFKHLAEMAKTADLSGHNVINFNEFVFIPEPEQDYAQVDYGLQMRSYYFFQPSYPRLQRMWQRESMLSSLNHGGHILAGSPVNLFPVDGVLRHYIALSEEQALAKYVGRIFAHSDLRRGWHANRITITEAKIRRFFESYSNYLSQIKILDNTSTFQLDDSNPQSRHFWDWPQNLLCAHH